MPRGVAILPFDSRKRDSKDLRRDTPNDACGPYDDASNLARGSLALRSGLERSNGCPPRPSGQGREQSTPGRVPAPSPNEPQLTRQLIRQLGFNEIRRQCKIQFPRYNRKEINSLARQIHDRAWQDRDREAVARAKHGA